MNNLPNFSQIVKELNSHVFDLNFAELAHQEIAPIRYKNQVIIPSNAIAAAVLLLIYPGEKSTNFVLIKRPTYEGNHSNQIALPGGKKDRNDKNIIQTALREAREEVNIQENNVKIIAELSTLYIPNSNFKVTPILAYSDSKPNFIANKREVESIIEVPIMNLIGKDIVQTTKIKMSNGIQMETPFLNIQNQIVWGATGMILNEFRRVILTKF